MVAFPVFWLWKYGKHSAVYASGVADLLSVGGYESNSHLPNNKISWSSAGAAP